MIKHKSNNSYWLICSLLIFIFLISASPYSFLDAVNNGFSDVSAYLSIAQKISGKSFDFLSNDIQLHHLERWPVHAFVGVIGRLINQEIWTLYKIFVLGGILFSMVLISNLNCCESKKIAYFALLLFSPYAFRIYYGVPGMLSDCLFFISLIGFSVAIFNHNFLLITLFAFIACLCRQSGLMLIPLIAVYSYLNKVLTLRAISSISFVILSLIFIKYSTQLLFQKNSDPYITRLFFSMYYWLSGNPNWKEFIDFFGRLSLMLLTLSPMLILLNLKNKISWFYILGFISFMIQPILGGPITTGGNIDRLAIYGLPILGLLLLYGQISSKYLFIFIVLVIACSFHPNLTILHSSEFNRYYFVILTIITAFISLYICFNKRYFIN